jgi:rhodanese-related sulfurtransferase
LKPIIDVRPAAAFIAGHLPGAASVPLEEIAARVHELPPRAGPLLVYDADPTRAAAAAAALTARGFAAIEVASGAPPLEDGTSLETGPSRARLWRPAPFVAECVPTLLAGGAAGGLVLDLGMGTGRNAVYLALQGFRVSGVDILPDAIERALDLARRHGVADRVTARVLDLRRVPATEAIPPARHDVILATGFLERALFPAIRAGVRPGGFVVYETFTEEQARRVGKPKNPARLLAPGELRAAFAGLGFDVLTYREGPAEPRRFVASLLARRVTTPVASL